MAVAGTRQATLQIFLCDDSQGLLPIKEQASELSSMVAVGLH